MCYVTVDVQNSQAGHLRKPGVLSPLRSLRSTLGLRRCRLVCVRHFAHIVEHFRPKHTLFCKQCGSRRDVTSSLIRSHTLRFSFYWHPYCATVDVSKCRWKNPFHGPRVERIKVISILQSGTCLRQCILYYRAAIFIFSSTSGVISSTGYLQIKNFVCS